MPQNSKGYHQKLGLVLLISKIYASEPYKKKQAHTIHSQSSSNLYNWKESNSVQI